MNRSRLQPIFHALVLAGAWTLAGLASAQYVWLDESGRKQYSDMPPPPSVAASRILKTPHAAGTPAPAPTAAETAANDKAKASPTLADKNAEFIKRRADQAEQEKKQAEQRRIADEKAKSCERARQYQKTLASGMRIATIDKNGERIFLDDAQRAQEESDSRSALEACE